MYGAQNAHYREKCLNSIKIALKHKELLGNNDYFNPKLYLKVVFLQARLWLISAQFTLLLSKMCLKVVPEILYWKTKALFQFKFKIRQI